VPLNITNYEFVYRVYVGILNNVFTVQQTDFIAKTIVIGLHPFSELYSLFPGPHFVSFSVIVTWSAGKNRRIVF